MFYYYLTTGLIATLTPKVFLLLVAVFFIFEVFTDTSMKHWLNSFIFAILVVMMFAIGGNYLFAATNSPYLWMAALFVILVNILFFIFCVWYLHKIGLFNRTSSEELLDSDMKSELIADKRKGNSILDKTFRWLGIYLIAFKVFSFALPSIFPLLERKAIDQSLSDIDDALFVGYSIGVVLPYILVLIAAGFLYPKIRMNSFFKNIQVLIGFILILGIIIELGNFMILSPI